MQAKPFCGRRFTRQELQALTCPFFIHSVISYWLYHFRRYHGISRRLHYAQYTHYLIKEPPCEEVETHTWRFGQSHAANRHKGQPDHRTWDQITSPHYATDTSTYRGLKTEDSSHTHSPVMRKGRPPRGRSCMTVVPSSD